MAGALTFIPLLILLCLTVVMEMKPPPHLDDRQVWHSLFGPHLSSLIMATHTPDDITKGASVQTGHALLGWSHRARRQEARRQEAMPAPFLDFLQHQAKMRRRGRKSMVGAGGRGCFGMKMDRIGSVSGLGC